MQPGPVPLKQLIAASIRARREQLDLSQDELAREMRARGFRSWTRAVVAAAERGSRRFEIDELLGLAVVLDRPLADLAASDSTVVHLGDHASMWIAGVQAMLSGARPRDLPELDRIFPLEVNEDRDLAGTDLVNLLARANHLPPGVPKRELVGRALIGAGGELEQRIARRLKTSAVEVAWAAVELWQRSASEERDRRAEERPRARAQVAREVVSEITAYMEKQRGR